MPSPVAASKLKPVTTSVPVASSRIVCGTAPPSGTTTPPIVSPPKPSAALKVKTPLSVRLSGVVSEPAGSPAPRARKIVLVDHQLATRHIQAGDRHPVIGALDGDGQRRRRNIAVGVGDRVVEHLRQRLPRGQRLNQRIGVVQRIGVGAVGSQNQRAMGAGRIAAHRARRRPEQHRRHRRPVGALNVGYPVRQVGVRRRHRRRRQHIAVGNQRTVFRHAVDIRRSRRHVVDDGHVQAGGGARAVRVGDLYRGNRSRSCSRHCCPGRGQACCPSACSCSPPCRARSPRRS